MVNILSIFCRRERVIGDEFLEFIPMGLVKIESRGKDVGVANENQWERDVDG